MGLLDSLFAGIQNPSGGALKGPSSGFAGQGIAPVKQGDVTTQVPGVVWRPGKGYVNAKTGQHYAMPGVLPVPRDPKAAQTLFGSQKAADAYTRNTDQPRVILPGTQTGILIPTHISGTTTVGGISTPPVQTTPVVKAKTPTGAGGGGTGTGSVAPPGVNTGVTPTSVGSMSDEQLAKLINNATQGVTPTQLALYSKQSSKDALAALMPQVNALKIQQSGLESEARSRAQLILQAGNESAKLLGQQLPSYTYAGAGKDLAAIGNLYGNSLNANQTAAVDNVASKVGAEGGSFNPYTTSGFNTTTAPALGTASTSFGSAALPAEEFSKNAAAQAEINHTLPLSLIGGAKQGALLSIGAGQQAAQKINPEIQNVLASLPKYAQTDLKSIVSNANLSSSQRLAGLKLYLAEHDKTASLDQGTRKLDQGDVKLTIDQQTSTSLANRRASQSWDDRYKLQHPTSQQTNPLTLAEELAHGSGAHTVSTKNADGSSQSKLVKAIPPAGNLTQAALIYAQNTGISLSKAMQTLAPYKAQWAKQYTSLLNSQAGQATATKLFGAGAGTSGSS